MPNQIASPESANAPVAHKNSTRLWTLLGTIITQFALGSVYTWSLFNAPLSDMLDEPVNQVALSFGILSLSLAVASSLSGKLQAKFGVRKVTIAAGVVLGLSLMAVSHVTGLWALYLTAGLLVGFADGTGYLMTLSNCVKFFPERKGLASACAIGAYGLGSLGFKYINLYFLTNNNLNVTFEVWGILVAAMVVLGGLMMKDAPLVEASTSSDNAQVNTEFSLNEATKTTQFWSLAIIFLTICMSGLYVIGVAKDIGESYAHLSVAAAASAVAVIAVANLSGRLVLGILSDKIERMRVVGIAVVICLLGVSALRFMPLTEVSFYIAIACVAFSFGGTITVYPSLVSDFFGLNNLTQNYGVIYLGFGIGSLLGSIVASLFGGFSAVFGFMLALLIISLAICLMIKTPTKANQHNQNHLVNA